MLVPGGLQYWADGSWMSLVAESWEFMTTGYADATPAASNGSSVSPEAADSAEPIGDTVAAIKSAPSEADTLQIRIRQGVMWSTGDEVTAQDYVDAFHIFKLQANTMWDYLGDIEALDDYTVNFYMREPSTVVERYVVRTAIRPSSVFYGEWAQKARDLFDTDASGDDEDWKQLLEQFKKFRPEGKLVVTGPYTIDKDSITTAQFDMPKNPNSYWAGKSTFGKMVNFNGETDAISAVVLSKNIDYATQGFAPATEQSIIGAGIRVLRPPTYSGAALKFNYNALPHFADKRVRHALAHAIDRDQAGIVALADSSVGVK